MLIRYLVVICLTCNVPTLPIKFLMHFGFWQALHRGGFPWYRGLMNAQVFMIIALIVLVPKTADMISDTFVPDDAPYVFNSYVSMSLCVILLGLSYKFLGIH